MNGTVSDTFTTQYNFGVEGVTEANAQFAEVWDGPIMVAMLLRKGDEWIVNHVDTDYVEPHHMADGYATVGEFVAFIHEELNA